MHFKSSDGHESWRDYDERGNCIHIKDSGGYESWRDYDERGNEIHYKTEDGAEWWYEYEFWEDGTVKRRTQWDYKQTEEAVR
ncbi:MAG: hypothetical protein J1F14_09075, partial [Treponema sp.]|nr:hypothetical protein [Treponema sp.]